MQSKRAPSGSRRTFVEVDDFGNTAVDDVGWVRERIHKAVFIGQVAILTLRKSLDTVQAVIVDKDMIKWSRKNLQSESIIIDIVSKITPSKEVSFRNVLWEM